MTRLPEATLAGLATSMRTFAAPAALAARGRIGGGRARTLMLAAAVLELAYDKTPLATDRIDARGLTARTAAGAYSGRVIAGLPGAAAGAAAAFVGAYAMWRARKLVVAATGLPDPVVGVGEDLLAYGTAALATRRTIDS